ncbi:MAG: alcohol dehydrogenase catalytic domain-containing protein [Saprospiraceae bacterium]|nr:alcohol dehydrogenase catalytic domain-containing protein [Saprospiraceae bacterium]
MTDTMAAAVLHGAKDIRVEKFKMPDLLPGMVLLKIKRVGICGSDLLYYKDGYCGAFVPSRPFILGHELTGEVVAVNGNTSKLLPIGTRVTVNPTRACGYCNYCKSGQNNLCRNTIMLGSGSTNPPTNGAMAEFLTVSANQCHVLPPGMEDGFGAMIEPITVGLHAIKQEGKVSGKNILITGGGTIGLLTAITAKAFGAAAVVVSDIIEERRQLALTCGVNTALNPMDDNFQNQVNDITGDGFDIIFEASGAETALRQAFDIIKSGGTIVQIGTLEIKDVPLPANQLMVKEIRYIGSFRYGNVFDEAIHLVDSGKIDLSPFITNVLPISEVTLAMSLAADKKNALKVQMQF